MIKGNIYDIRSARGQEAEVFEDILSSGNLRIERIISSGQATPEGEWYDQETDEWVLLLTGRAVLEFSDGTRLELTPGDYLFLPAHLRHRVSYTSSDPKCIWLAVHRKLS